MLNFGFERAGTDLVANTGMRTAAPSGLGQRLLDLALASLGGAPARAPEPAQQWVALDRCRYDEGSEHPSSGRIVDSDSELGELITRLRSASRRRCIVIRWDHDYERDPDAPDTLRRVSRLSTAA